MPTYQYACTSDACGIEFERVQAFTDPAITECPECAARVRKVYGSVGVVFKGSGFYRTDSREAKGAGAGAGGSSSSEASSNSTNGSSSGETKSKSDSSKPAGDSASKSSTSNAKPAAAAAS